MDTQQSTDERNREIERQEIQHLHTGPDKVFLYVQMPKVTQATEHYTNCLPSCCRLALSMHAYACPVCRKTSAEMQGLADRSADVITWLGTPIATHVYIGPRRAMGFGYHSYRRPMSCRINGTRYHGWFFESSGDYCRLTKAKREGGK